MFTKDRRTVNVGARFDKQTAKNLASEAPANASFPNLLPALKFDGSKEDNITWNDISPRVGLSYALSESRKTVVRLSLARYAGQLSYGNVAGATGQNPVAASYLAYGWNDANGDRFGQPDSSGHRRSRRRRPVLRAGRRIGQGGVLLVLQVAGVRFRRNRTAGKR